MHKKGMHISKKEKLAVISTIASRNCSRLQELNKINSQWSSRSSKFKPRRLNLISKSWSTWCQKRVQWRRQCRAFKFLQTKLVQLIIFFMPKVQKQLGQLQIWAEKFWSWKGLFLICVRKLQPSPFLCETSRRQWGGAVPSGCSSRWRSFKSNWKLHSLHT